MPKLYTLYVFCLWYISSSHEAVAERVLVFQQDAHIRCPGLPLAEYCDCTGDCYNHPDFCACEEAQSCCPGFQTEKPEVVFHILGICSASLSVIGSFLILLKIIRGIRSTSPYDRFILGLSTFDIIASIVLLVDHFLAPDKTTIIRTYGHDSREICYFLNPLSKFFTLLSVWYNGLLSVYFLLRVLSQLKRKDLVTKYERWLHSSLILVVVVFILLFWYFEWTITDGEVGSTCYMDGAIFIFDISGLFSVLVIIINYSVIYAIVRKTLGSNHGPSPEQNRRKREVTTLMILYVGSFFVTFTPSFVWSFIWANAWGVSFGVQDTFPLRLSVAATYPLQGFLNAFIYFKPAYTRVRASHPSKSIFFVLYHVLLSRSAPKTHHHRDGQHVTGGSVYVTDITRVDMSSTVPVDANANTEDDAGDGITGVDFGSSIFLEADPAAEDDNSPLEAVAEEESVDSNS